MKVAYFQHVQATVNGVAPMLPGACGWLTDQSGPCRAGKAACFRAFGLCSSAPWTALGRPVTARHLSRWILRTIAQWRAGN